MGRVVAVVAALVGLTLIGFALFEHLPARAGDAQKVADHYRPLMSTQGLTDLRTGFNSLKAAGAELDASALPRLRQRMGMTQAQFDAYVSTSMPGIKAFNDQAPGVVALVEPVIGQMEAERSDYHQADQIPAGFLGLRSAPWLFLGIGGLLVVLGLVGVARPAPTWTAAIAVVGLGLLVAPLVLGIPGKVNAARRVTRLGKVGLAPATGAKAVGATALFDGMEHDVSTTLEPAWAAVSGTGDTFATDFPAVARFTKAWRGGISAQSHALSNSQVALAPTFANANRIPLRPVPWLFIVPGALLALLGGMALTPAARLRHAPAPAVPTLS